MQCSRNKRQRQRVSKLRRRDDGVSLSHNMWLCLPTPTFTKFKQHLPNTQVRKCGNSLFHFLSQGNRFQVRFFLLEALGAYILKATVRKNDENLRRYLHRIPKNLNLDND